MDQNEQKPVNRLETLRRAAEEAEAKAKAKALNSDEAEESAYHERIAKANEEAAAADRIRRANDGKAREMAAETTAAGRYLVAAVDLVECFSLGKAPPVEKLPTGGVIIVRSPEPEASDTFTREYEHKKRPLSDIFADLLCASVVDPKPDSPDGAKLRAFCDAFKDAAIDAGATVRKLGGAKAREDKRGRG